MRFAALLNRARSNPVTVMLLVVVLALGAWAVYTLVKRGKETFDYDKCKADSTKPRCPQSNLDKAGYGCLSYDKSKCCKENMWDCKAMDTRNISYSWAKPMFFSDTNTNEKDKNKVLSADQVGIGVGWKNLDNDLKGWDNRISAVRVTRGYVVELSDGKNGEQNNNILRLEEGVHDLTNYSHPDGQKYSANQCEENNNGCWNDSATAIQIHRK